MNSLFTTSDYQSALLAHLPRGRVWQTGPDNPLTKLSQALATSFQRVDAQRDESTDWGFPGWWAKDHSQNSVISVWPKREEMTLPLMSFVRLEQGLAYVVRQLTGMTGHLSGGLTLSKQRMFRLNVV
ncbi:hypothetical protein [Candidatus Williamhamiltonella defendens]|uniref:hypothetical protein n=1 Tax=Candidatus Williamhamiltonella defendens TaxID=138072 RepID=UPI0020C670D4|nr:hypothetical protein [Candidatus Hamiltonella defensa]